MASKTRNWFILIFILAFPCVLFLGSLLFELNRPFAPIQPLPNPNGYDDFVKAGQIVSTNTFDFDKMNEAQLSELVATNADALSLVRAGLKKKCLVAIEFSESYIENHLSELSDEKRLAQAFAAEGKLAEMENHPADAAKSYLDAFHFGDESSRGGVLINELVDIAIEAISTSHLTNLVDSLDAKSCRETAATLETLDSQSQTLDEVMQQEHDWSIRTFSSLRDKIFRPLLVRMTKPAYQNAQGKFQKNQIKTRQLIIDLAARAYELDKGKSPASLTDLVPDYLKAIPQDPLTGTNIIYSPR